MAIQQETSNFKLVFGDQLMRVAEAADCWAVRPSTVRSWILRRKISVVRISPRAVRIPASEVRRVISAGTLQARSGGRE